MKNFHLLFFFILGLGTLLLFVSYILHNDCITDTGKNIQSLSTNQAFEVEATTEETNHSYVEQTIYTNPSEEIPQVEKIPYFIPHFAPIPGPNDKIVIKIKYDWFQENYFLDNCMFSKEVTEYDYFLTENFAQVQNTTTDIFFSLENEYHGGQWTRGRKSNICELFCTSETTVSFNNYSSILRNAVLHFINNLLKDAEAAAVEKNHEKKKDKILVMMSNCDPNRWNYVKSLAKDIGNEHFVYCGKCSGWITPDPGCTKRNDYLASKSLSFISKYKYYLSLENSHCNNYITEKFSKVLVVNSIPIIYDLKYFPPNLLKMNNLSNKVYDLSQNDFSLKNLRNNSYEGFSNLDILHIYQPEERLQLCRRLNMLRNNVTFRQQEKEKISNRYSNCMRDCKNTFGCVPFPTQKTKLTK